mgnify:CR=1 FL=1
MKAAFQKFDSYVEALAHKVHHLGADTLKVMLSNVAPVRTNSVKAELIEIAPGNGYPAGGELVTITRSGQTRGIYSLTGNNVVFTASGGTIGPFRFAALYNDTAFNDELVGWWEYPGRDITLGSGEEFTVKFGPSILTNA